MKQKMMIQLIEKCKQKEESAFQDLYKEYYPMAYRLAYHIAKSHADASDIAQETLIAVYDHINNLHSPQFFPLWLKRIVVSKCNRAFRYNKHVTYVEDETIIQQMCMDSKDINHPQRIIHFDTDQEVLRFFIKQLPEKQAEVLCHFYFDQWSIKEISKNLDIPDGTVKSRMLLGKKQLKKSITNYEQTNAISLDFKSDAILGMAGISTGFLSLQTLRHGLTSSLSATSTIAVVSTGIILTSGSILGYQFIQNQKDVEQVQPNVTQSTQLPKKAFQAVDVAGYNVETPRDAYFKILLWADQRKQLEHKTDDEIKEFQILMESLKGYGGPYYEAVLGLDWIKNYTEK